MIQKKNNTANNYLCLIVKIKSSYRFHCSEVIKSQIEVCMLLSAVFHHTF